jgi:SP family facilitated glucose transporter-like MFS transporter 8
MSERDPLLGSRKIEDKVSGFFWVCILASAVGAFVFGFSLGYSSPTIAANIPGQPKTQCVLSDDGSAGSSDGLGEMGGLPPLNPDNKGMLNCDLRLSEDTVGWFGSLINIGCLAGALSGGKFCDLVGKKMGMSASFLFYTVGWLCLALAPKGEAVTEEDQTNVKVLLFASRLIVGFAIGIVCCSVSNYQTEIATTEIRGTIGTVFQLAITIGLVAAYGIGTLLKDWRVMSYIMVATSLSGFVATFILVETPTYYMLKGDHASALSAQKRLRTENSDVRGAVDALKSDSGGEGGGSVGMNALCRGNAPKALAIGVGLMFVQQLSGINAVMFYCGSILQSVYPDPTTANMFAVGIQVMQVIITAISAPLMDKAGRKPILLFALVGLTISSGTLAAYYSLETDCHKDAHGDEVCPTHPLPDVVAVIALYSYVFFFSSGLGAIPWFLMGEIFPAEVKGLASSIATAVNWGLSFVITKTVNSETDLFGGQPKGLGGVFGGYGVICLLGIFFVKCFIPETKGKSFDQIQAEIGGGGSERGFGSVQQQPYKW